MLTIGCRNYTTQVPAQTAGEVRITEILRQKFAGATYIKVEDISGMYRSELVCLCLRWVCTLSECNSEQECIPVGCLPTAAVAAIRCQYSGVPTTP